ncbi:hypothetical protein OSB04_017318 [Centaurea solstitialis]|uniref:Myb/SANT-like domain-containing protein n=1 Tax=Centaurea solstitialis TaxID=347529 RepID=A0AA38T2N8_9ASTR|nr:hypothetical protein OSB04_017318 [Centaurea solstitialis]
MPSTLPFSTAASSISLLEITFIATFIKLVSLRIKRNVGLHGKRTGWSKHFFKHVYTRRLKMDEKAQSWKNVGEELRKKHNFIVDQRQMKNHYDYIKGKYAAFQKLKNKTGNVYDSTTNTFNLTEEEWKIEISISLSLSFFIYYYF